MLLEITPLFVKGFWDIKANCNLVLESFLPKMVRYDFTRNNPMLCDKQVRLSIIIKQLIQLQRALRATSS